MSDEKRLFVSAGNGLHLPESRLERTEDFKQTVKERDELKAEVERLRFELEQAQLGTLNANEQVAELTKERDEARDSALTLHFRRFKDEKPADGAEILYVSSSDFYSSYSIQFGQTEYQWEELDEDEHPTGTTYFTENGASSAPEGCRLLICIGGMSLGDNTLWCPASEMDTVLDKARSFNRA